MTDFAERVLFSYCWAGAGRGWFFRGRHDLPHALEVAGLVAVNLLREPPRCAPDS